MAISLKTHKLLWGRSGNQCAICKNDLIVDSEGPDDDPSIVGDEAHIVARKESFTRGNYDELTPEQRDHYSNLILLCKVHHKQIDDQPAQFTVDKLRAIKVHHEREVMSHRTGPDRERQEADITLSGYVDHWARQSDLDNWGILSSHVNSANTPSLPKDWYEAQQKFLTWIIGRIWPTGHPGLRAALFNYKTVLQDFLNVFDKHVENRRDKESYFYTRKFYKIEEYNPKLYAKLSRQYDDHVDLVCDLFFELTRATNYVCDQVRNSLFPGYRVKEGAVLMERHDVGFDLRSERVRLEYRGKERIKKPYPGLKKFKKIRYSRDYAISPNPPEPPKSVDDED